MSVPPRHNGYDHTVIPRGLAVLAVTASCGLGNIPADYAPQELRDLGLHAAPTYVARSLMPARGIPLVLAHPRLGQPAIRRAGEIMDIMWIAPGSAATPVAVSLQTGMTVGGGAGTCDDDGICHLAVAVPSLAAGLYGVCVTVGTAEDCSPNALAVVDAYADPAAIVHISDAHVGDGDSLSQLTKVVDALNAVSPAPDLIVFTGDGADTGKADQRGDFVAQMSRLAMPVYIVTGNHDYDAFGIEGHLLDVGPELDMDAWYGGLHLVGLSSGQDLDDGDHNTTISESSGPDRGQLDWFRATLDTVSPTVAFFHHPIYNGLFATIGPDARDELKGLVTRSNMLAVLTGHTHSTAVYDADGNSRGLSLDSGVVPPERWPLHYVVSRVTKDSGGYALLHLGSGHVDYRWVGLP
jgi:predicted phosphodiesterase